MKWSKAKLIFLREVRDQLRDRRTLLMILVLPIVLYPALGIGLFQLTLSFGKQNRTVGIVGAEDLPPHPPLLAEDRQTFHTDLFGSNGRPSVLKTIVNDKLTRDDINREYVDAIVQIPHGMARRLAAGENVTVNILFNGTDDRSEIASAMLRDLLYRWSDQVGEYRLSQAGLPRTYAHPISIEDGFKDVSRGSGRSGTAWSRMFPFLLVMMALTGAFYPAVDLCAGEKERGTMETLLISPATRAEIVLGKFLTIFLFSVITTIVNLTSMGLTLAQTSNMIPAGVKESAAALLAPPSWVAIGWMMVLMLPLAAFFSAMCMALAIFARSTKEGQYYLMPLFLVVTPLVFLTLVPGVELDAFYSLVPVTNVALLLKSLMLNQYESATLYFLPVLIPTLLYGFLALRYAADQFNREDVLFREAERFDIAVFLRQCFVEKRPGITFSMAWSFFVFYMLLRWYLQGHLPITPMGIIASQVGTLAIPAIVGAYLFTRRPMRSLQFRKPIWSASGLAVLLAITIHPVAVSLALTLQQWFPMPDASALAEKLAPIFLGVPYWQQLIIVAVVPAVCEEIAFRGWILPGLLQQYRPAGAIVISAVLFGVSHMVPQQMVAATLLGIVLGIVATRTGSVLPGMVFHAFHNGMIVTYMGRSMEAGNVIGYPSIVVLMGGLASTLLLGMLVSKPSRMPRFASSPLFDSSSQKTAVAL
ncbi:CPBP family intramembrane metalloprotease [bacterium]|nr:CPBP family intramembrane metalloprotease [bacterium]